jgi:thioredoxin-related protein
MRKLYILLLLVSSLFSSEVKFASDFQSGVKEATQNNKPIFFLFSRHSCKYCVIFENETLKDATVIKALNKDFTSIVSFTDEHDYTPRELWRPGTPTLWFLDSKGEPMFDALVGAVDKENFLKALALVKEEFDKKAKKDKI